MRTNLQRATPTLSVLCLAGTLALHAQQPGPPAAPPQPPDPNVPLFFEVASVKPNTSGERNGMLRRNPGGRMNAANMPLRQIIVFAYQPPPFTLVGGPAWINDERYDIAAKLDGDPAPLPPGSGPDHMMLATRSLLADRFKLKLHKETRDLEVYALVMAKPGGPPGSGLKLSTEDCSPEAMRARLAGGGAALPAPGAPFLCGARMGPGRLQMSGMPIAVLVSTLGGLAGRPILDRTGLQGNWDALVTYAIDPGRGAPPPDAAPPDPNAPSIFTALQEQLGLKLESAKAPMEVLVIDSIERPTPD